MIRLTPSDWSNHKKMDLFLTPRNRLIKKKILFSIFFLLEKGCGAMVWWKSLIPGDDWPVSPLSSCSPGSPDSPLSVVAAGLSCSLLTARHERKLRVFSGPRYRVTSDRSLPSSTLYNYYVRTENTSRDRQSWLDKLCPQKINILFSSERYKRWSLTKITVLLT